MTSTSHTSNEVPHSAPLTGVIVVDHGSRREESNRMLLDAVRLFESQGRFAIVEPAHMELAAPTIADAFDRCVARGAARVIVFPYFLLPGRHWRDDIPRLTAEAASRYPGVEYLVSAPFGVDLLMADVMQARIDHCLEFAAGRRDACSVCDATTTCRLQRGSTSKDPRPQGE